LVNLDYPNQILIEKEQREVIVTETNTELVITSSDVLLSSIITETASGVTINYTSILGASDDVTITNGWTLVGVIDNFGIKVTMADSTTITGPAGWNGLLELRTFTSVPL